MNNSESDLKEKKRYTDKLYMETISKIKNNDALTDQKSFILSKRERNCLEVTVKKGCGLMCSYCPQKEYIKNYKTKQANQDGVLRMDTFSRCMQNVDTSTIIKWTGFTEPFENKEFRDFSQYLYEHKYDQEISTTLHGRKESQDYFLEHIDRFQKITLHLPDNSNLMKLKVREDYIELLDNIINKAFRENLCEKITYFLIGDEFHEDVIRVIKKALYDGKIKHKQIHAAEVLNTRNSNIDISKISIKRIKSRDTSEITNKNNAFYCAYRRLNQGVMLPSGDVVICCQDYSIDFILGSLLEKNLLDLYQVIESDEKLKSDFLNGSFNPCVKCEHYLPVDHGFTGSLAEK